MKTSTGFHNSGANEEAVKAMLEASKGLIRLLREGSVILRQPDVRLIWL